MIAERLAAAGVRRAFGFPGGGSNLDLIEALAGVGVEFVLARTEVSAALMACAEAELTGVPGVVVVGSGPGLASVVDGVAHAWLDRVPLLVVSDRSTDAEIATTGHQVLDQRALLAPVVKWSCGAGEVERALAIAAAAPCGPVHVEVPRDWAPAGAVAEPRIPASSPAAASLEAIAARLAGARRPVVVAGLEARGCELAPLAERLGAGVLTTYKAKGVLDERHPLWAGIVTGGALEAPLLEAADAILAVGVDPVELLAKPWPYAAPLLALRACGLGAEYGSPAAVWFGDVAAGVRELTARLPGEGSPPTRADVAGHRERALAALRVPSDTPLTAWGVVEALSEELPAETVVAVDAGAHMFAATWFWRARAPRRFLISNGLATMGFAVPAAVAAARDAPAVAITGDGGMAYGAFELETAVRSNARVLVVVCDDASLGLIRIKHEAKGHDRSRLDFGPVRFDALAAALGAASWVADDDAGLRRAIRAAGAASGPALIDARMSGAEYARTLAIVRG